MTIWFKQLLADVKIVQIETTSIMCNNLGCIAHTENFFRCTKHIDAQHQISREKLENEEICLDYYSTKDMITSLLTKILAKNRHQGLTKAMRL